MFSLLLLFVVGAALVVPAIGDDDDGGSDRSSDERIKGSPEDDVIDGTSGNDEIVSWKGDDTINAGAGEDEIKAGEGNDTVFGGDDRDVIKGGPGDDMLFGEEGSDTIEGGAGDDTMDGGYGFDIMRGGNGNDIMFGGPAARAVGGDLIPETGAKDIVRGEDGEDEIYIWGALGKAVGGDDDDTLVLVTGNGTLEDEQGETDFIILANAADDAPTNGIITEFNPAQDTLTLTVDGVLNGAPAPDVEFTLTETTITEGSNTVNGVMVRAQIEAGEAVPAESEGSQVFLRGATIAQLSGATINVEFTDDASYFNPEETVAGLASV